jgi:UDP-N-acetylglucosamine 2-epimerase (non-hydrolysing)
MYEVLKHYEKQINQSNIITELGLKPKEYFLVSIHREENVDNSCNLTNILGILNRIAEKYSHPVIVSTHPRTSKKMEALGTPEMDDRIRFLKPFGYHDYLKLQMNAVLTISDSGTISEESAILGFPAISLREATERPEALDAGTIILTGLDIDTVFDAVGLSIKEPARHATLPPGYMVKDVSWRVLRLILGTAKLSNKWAGVVRNDLSL